MVTEPASFSEWQAIQLPLFKKISFPRFWLHENIKFFKSVDNEFGIGYELYPDVGDPFLVLLNSSKETANFNLLSEKWNLVLTNNELSNKKNNSTILSGQSVAVYKGVM